jgi:hypothetical protein
MARLVLTRAGGSAPENIEVELSIGWQAPGSRVKDGYFFKVYGAGHQARLELAIS